MERGGGGDLNLESSYPTPRMGSMLAEADLQPRWPTYPALAPPPSAMGVDPACMGLCQGWGEKGLRGAGVVRAHFPDHPPPPGVAPVTSC